MREAEGWRIYTPRHAPHASIEGHLTFALKYEGIDLAVLHALFQRIFQKDLTSIVVGSPTGGYARRIWFLYEWLTDGRLPIEDLHQGSYVQVVDPEMQVAIDGERVKRHRVVNNLPGTPRFCPLVFRTEKINEYVAKNLRERARERIGRIPQDLLSRASAFLLLKDSKASYTIEGEQPPQSRIQRWGRAIGQAGMQPLDMDELIRLQRTVIGDRRFVRIGLRNRGGFVGEHDRDTGVPIPEHISARPDDLEDILGGLIDFDRMGSLRLDPVVAAACLAFGFVYIHPFEDGNGRVHRYLIHHVLSESGFNPPGMVFPVSSVILKRLSEYREVLQQYSHRILPLIEWEVSEDMNVEVQNSTDHLYRFFDATPQVEFLFACVEETIEKDLPDETRFLQRYDVFRRSVEKMVDMPDTTVHLLYRFLRQNGGRLSKRAREKEFAHLREDELLRIEELYATQLEDLS